MKVTVIGASGFIGRHLCAALQKRGDTVASVSFRQMDTAVRESEGADVVVNLAGESIAVRWTPEIKERIRSSRVDFPREFIKRLAELRTPPKTYISASAVGYYGTSETKTFTEASPPGSDFLAEVCVAWEAEARRAEERGCRVAIVRTGLVMSADGGVMARLLPVFRLGMGGVAASGNQWCSWIHIDDLIGIYLMAIDRGTGVYNATSPNPVRNRDFTKALAAVLHRPAIVPVPEFVFEQLLGEGSTIVTQGQCVIPERTRDQGYSFRHTLIDRACAAVVRPGK